MYSAISASSYFILIDTDKRGFCFLRLYLPLPFSACLKAQWWEHHAYFRSKKHFKHGLRWDKVGGAKIPLTSVHLQHRWILCFGFPKRYQLHKCNRHWIDDDNRQCAFASLIFKKMSPSAVPGFGFDWTLSATVVHFYLGITKGNTFLIQMHLSSDKTSIVHSASQADLLLIFLDHCRVHLPLSSGYWGGSRL